MKWFAVTNRKLCNGSLYEQVEMLCRLKDKPAVVIIREKDLEQQEYIRLAKPIYQVCVNSGVECIFHTFYGAALQCGVSAIHVPLALLLEKPELARSFDKLGVSVHSVNDAMLACENGADYITFGHVFETDCKKGAKPRGILELRTVAQAVKQKFPDVHVYAIGGINAQNALQCIENGADGVCVMSGAMKLSN